MICLRRSEKSDLLEVIHGKPSPMKLARKFSSVIGLIAIAVSTSAQSGAQTPAKAEVWVASWGTSQQVPEPQNALPADDLRDSTVRQIFHLSVGGRALRVHLSNAFGTEALHFTSVHIARPLSPSSSAIEAASDRPLTFAGSTDVEVPPGAEFLSDPLDFPVAPLSDLAVTFHLDAPPARQTGHPGSRATSYYVHGDFVSAANLIEPKHVDHWYQVADIDVQTAPGGAAIVGHRRFHHRRARRHDERKRSMDGRPGTPARLTSTRNIGVSNQGIGGNHLLTDGLGPNVLSRFDRDVLAPAGVQWVIVFEGVNDLGGLARLGEVPASEHAALVQRVIAAYQQVIERAHAHGLRVYGATITPYVGSTYYHPGPFSEADRQTVNKWIRTAGNFDAVIDFEPWSAIPSTLISPARLRLR